MKFQHCLSELGSCWTSRARLARLWTGRILLTPARIAACWKPYLFNPLKDLLPRMGCWCHLGAVSWSRENLGLSVYLSCHSVCFEKDFLDFSDAGLPASHFWFWQVLISVWLLIIFPFSVIFTCPALPESDAAPCLPRGLWTSSGIPSWTLSH